MTTGLSNPRPPCNAWPRDLPKANGGAIGRRCHLIALELQCTFERLPNAAIVFGDEDESVRHVAVGHEVVPGDGWFALVTEQGRPGVYVLERDVARFAAVTVGERRSGRAVIESGLSGGEQVVLAPPASLQDGDRVRRKGAK